jgi:hypothetical protein
MRAQSGGPESGQPFTSEMVNVRRFWTRVKKGDACWEWRGARNARTGYGGFNVIQLRRGPVAAHRVAYVLKHGSIPAGALVMHRCDNKLCVNPAHLELGTNRQNIQDAITRERMGWQRDRVCRRGHKVAARSRCATCAKLLQDRMKRAELLRNRTVQHGVLAAFVKDELSPVLPVTLAECVTRTDERRATIIARFFELYGAAPASLTTLGRQYGVSRERCRQLRDDALRKLGITDDTISRLPRVGGWKRITGRVRHTRAA